MKKDVRVYWTIDNPILVKGFQSVIGSEIEIEINNHYLSENHVFDYDFKTDSETEIIILIIRIPASRSDFNMLLYKLLKRTPELKIVVLIERFDYQQLRFLFHVGVAGAICPNIKPGDFISVFRDVLKKKKGVSVFVKEKIVEEYCKASKIPFDKDDGKASRTKEEQNFSDSLYNLTDREKEILKLICQGKLTREIADELFISLHTIETHRRNLLRKMEVKNTAQMVKVAIVNQMIAV